MIEFMRNVSSSNRSYAFVEGKEDLNTGRIKGVLAMLCVTALFLVSALPAMAQVLFTVSDMKVAPSETTVGQTVTITAAITNLGDVDGTYTAELKINGEIVDSQDVKIGRAHV